MTALPESIGKLTVLQDVSLKGNPLRGPFEVLGVIEGNASPALRSLLARSAPHIRRFIEFPPEYKSAGVAILSHFNEILQSKYKGIKTGVTITQEGDNVTMIVETPEGHVEPITKTLNDYGLVVRGEMAPEELLDSQAEIIELKAQVRHAYSLVEMKRDLLQVQGAQIEKLHQHIDLLIRNQPKLLESQPTPVVQVSPTMIQQNASIDPSQLVTELSQLRAELMTEAESPEQFKALTEVAKAEEAARSGDGSKAVAHLKKAGKWALDVAETLALEAAKAAVRGQFG